ncbi:Uncharacterized protein PCOAH_00004660 [Plasmodium coatneyi]|uniref:Uncharacterized protein n=1 Tax=Plasmodium coatneyi TaxID=208452 RepID=A0A1B1DTY6_9APIC|nr:Uncharacterized protein PCOAH_00004660 [Plasmodium coatneyi]ANQ06233.1 Uncharacterized protein PCOAH_00004660 [Plasmodium coatneyi]
MAPVPLVALVAYLSLSQRTSSNVVVHPSLTDFFVERIGDHIFTSFDNVISKRLSSPSCSSSADTSCHLVHAGAIGCADEQTGQDTKQQTIKRREKKKVTYNEQDDEKYTYLHTTPFYAIPREGTYPTSREWENEEDKSSEKEPAKNKDGRNVWMKGFHFLVDVFTSITRKKQHPINTSKKLPPSYFINYRRTNIVGDTSEFSNKPTKYNFKGLFIGEHLNDAKNFSFLSPLSLAIDEIDFNQIFMQAWDVDSYSSYVFLDNADLLGVGKDKKKKAEGSPGGNVSVGKEEKSSNLSQAAATPTSSRADGWVGNIQSILDLSNNGKEEHPPSKHPSEGEHTDEVTPPQVNETDAEEKKKHVTGKHVTPNTIKKILNRLRIPSETSNYDGMVKTNRQMKVGICTRQSRAGSLLQLVLKKTLVSSSPYRKHLKGKGKKHTDHPPFTCAFFRSVNHSEVVLFFEKITSPNGITPGKTTWNEQTPNGRDFTKEVFKLKSSALYKKWSNRNNHHSRGFTDIISTNPLKNLTVHANYEYKKNLFKLHADYNGISKSIMVVRSYEKKALLKFIFQVDICYNELYVDNAVQMRYVNSDVKPNLILRGKWSCCTLGGPHHFYNDRNNKVDSQQVGGVDEPVRGDGGGAPPHESPQPETDTGKIYWHEQILNNKVEPAERYKRLKSLSLENPRLEEIRERTYWMDRHVRNSGDVLLLSTKGSVEFKTPVVVSDLYVRLHPNPLYRSACGGKVNAQETLLDACKQGKPYNMHVLFNFYLNKSKKYSAALEIYVEALHHENRHRYYTVRQSPGHTNPLNVMTLLKGNINQYRVNKIEIEYSFNPHPLVQREESIHHSRLPFLVSVCNITTNQSQKVYNYVPTFFVSRGDFLLVLSRIEPNEGETPDTTGTTGTGSTTSAERNHNNKHNRFISNTSFSIFTSLSEPIFWAHIMQLRCGVSQCHYDQTTERFLVTTLGGRQEGMTQVSQEVIPQRRLFQPNAHIVPSINGKNIAEGEDAEMSEIQKAYLDLLERGQPSESQQPSGRMGETNQTTTPNAANTANAANAASEPRPPQLTPPRKEQIVAYDMTNMLNLEHTQKRYIIPPYRKGIYICLESKRNQLVYDPNDYLFYRKRSEKINVGNDTRDAMPAMWIYSALLPTESALLDLSFLTKNKFTLKMVQTNDTKVYFKNIIPLTRYEDYTNIEKHYSENVIKISFIDLKQNGFMSDLLGQTIDSQLYRAKVIEFLKSKFSTVVQFASEDMGS